MTFLGNHWLLDDLDIAIVTVIFYKLYVFIRSTRSLSMFMGLLLSIAAGLLADWLGLHGLNWIIADWREPQEAEGPGNDKLWGDASARVGLRTRSGESRMLQRLACAVPLCLRPFCSVNRD